MTDITPLSPDLIDGRSDARPLDSATIDGLIQSVKEIGLINPIRVRRLGDRYEIVSGHHRFGVCAFLGWAEIPCIVVDDDDLHAELAMIDENLMRNELSASDRAVQTARRKAIYLKLHPETVAGAAQAAGMNRSVGNNVADNLSATFTAATAKATGKDERSVRRDAERGEKVIPEVIDLIRGTKLDTGVYLDKVKKLSPNEQVQAAKRDLAMEKKRADGSRRQSTQNASIEAGGLAKRYRTTPAAAEQPPVTFDDIRAALETLCQLKAEDFQKLCPPNKRPAMHQRMDRLITVFEQVKEAVSG
jgi:ParB/RepB/Spo0J family partition protein